MRYEKEYNLAFREGEAIAVMEFLERAVKYKFPNEYNLKKHKIRRLSEYEVELILYEIMKTADIRSLNEFL